MICTRARGAGLGSPPLPPLAGTALRVPLVAESREAAGDGCIPVVALCSAAVCMSLRRTCEAAERVLIACGGGEEEGQQNLWVLERGEQQRNGQMGHQFSREQHVGERFCFDLERSLRGRDAVGGRGNLHHILGVCSLLK